MATRKSKKRYNPFIHAALMTVLSVAVLFGVHIVLAGSGPLDPTSPVAIQPVDSSYCIACHIDPDTIEGMAVMDDDGGHGGEGG